MKILLLHPEDTLPVSETSPWDLVVDLARAPASTYQEWGRTTHSRVVSLSDFCRQEDRTLLREQLRLGKGQMIDREGIDWWDVLSLMISPELHRLILVSRLAKDLPAGTQVFATRPCLEASALGGLLGVAPGLRDSALLKVRRRFRHYRQVATHLDAETIFQVAQDKYDNRHRLRRRLARRQPRLGRPAVLLPSAYVNVSRTAVSYAALLPQEQFLLVHARNSGRLKVLPSNVAMVPLDPYFCPSDRGEIQCMQESWAGLRQKLIQSSEAYRVAEGAGALARMPALLNWGLAIRDAWSEVFESQPIRACLSADDNNPYTRIPLILAKRRGLATVACHHGAFDYRVALKETDADIYLAKSMMEWDYLVHQCGMTPERIAVGGPMKVHPSASVTTGPRSDRSWLVMFTEPYGAQGWRAEEVYRELLPPLLRLARVAGAKLVFKLHPFEDKKGQWRLLKRVLPAAETREIEVVEGIFTEQMWQNTRIALTVQSTMALDCVTRGVPVFLCAWLRTLETGFVEQFSRFGIGEVLNSPGELAEVPLLLKSFASAPLAKDAIWKAMDPRELHDALSGLRKPSMPAPEMA